MNKYIEVVRTGWKEILIYRFDVIVNSILAVFRIVLAFIMWGAIYNSRQEVAGFSFSMMLTYYIIISFLTKLDQSNNIARKMAYEIRNGQFTKYIVKPVSPMLYYFSLVFSRVGCMLLYNAAAFVVWIAIFNKYFVFPKSAAVFFWAVIIFLLGLVFMALLNFFFSILAFWVLEVSAFFMIKANVMEFLTGALVPLSLLPAGLVAVFKYLPFYYIYYYPVSLYMNQGIENIGTAVITLIVWSTIFFIANLLVYRVAVKSYDGVGI